MDRHKVLLGRADAIAAMTPNVSQTPSEVLVRQGREAVDECFIWSIKMNAWMGAGGGTSDIKQAKRYGEVDALYICAKQRDGEGNMLAFPVPCRFVEELSK